MIWHILGEGGGFVAFKIIVKINSSNGSNLLFYGWWIVGEQVCSVFLFLFPKFTWKANEWASIALKYIVTTTTLEPLQTTMLTIDCVGKIDTQAIGFTYHRPSNKWQRETKAWDMSHDATSLKFLGHG